MGSCGVGWVVERFIMFTQRGHELKMRIESLAPTGPVKARWSKLSKATRKAGAGGGEATAP